MIDNPIVTIKHMRKLKYCSRGIRTFFTRHDLSWSDFLSDGIPASELEKTRDSMALRVVEVARGEE